MTLLHSLIFGGESVINFISGGLVFDTFFLTAHCEKNLFGVSWNYRGIILRYAPSTIELCQHVQGLESLTKMEVLSLSIIILMVIHNGLVLY